MAKEPETEYSSLSATGDEEKKRSEAREIRGNIPYTASPNSIGRVLEAIKSAERPDKFSNSFMETVLGQTGGGARSVPPFLKKMGFLTGDGTPTELYSRFQTESGRSDAIFEGMKNAFEDLFRKNTHAHKASDEKILDLIIEVTGLTKSDPVSRHMLNSFKNVKEFLPKDFTAGQDKPLRDIPRQGDEERPGDDGRSPINDLGLSYHINIVLPESENPVVYDTIFKSLKRNLL